MQAHIGTSGWNYSHWKGIFYPPGTPQTKWLEYYAAIFPTVEANVTFYRQLSQSTFEKWKQRTPPGFVWAVKASRFITHIKKLRDAEEPLRTFLHSACALGEKLGPILFQLPPTLAFDPRSAEAFFSLLPPGNRYALEARHESWTGREALALLERRGIAWCIADTAGRYPYLEAVTAGFVYIRLHGSRKLYASEYTKDEIDAWAQKMRSWNLPAYVYFDNDFMAYAVKNALELRQAVGGT